MLREDEHPAPALHVYVKCIFIASVVFLLVSQIPLSDTARLEFDRIGLYRHQANWCTGKCRILLRKNEWTQSVKSYPPILRIVLYSAVLYCALVESICPRLGVWI